MTKEFNLSEKIKHNVDEVEFIYSRDVKEFILKLKSNIFREFIKLTDAKDKLEELEVLINKLAGDKLI